MIANAKALGSALDAVAEDLRHDPDAAPEILETIGHALVHLADVLKGDEPTGTLFRPPAPGPTRDPPATAANPPPPWLAELAEQHDGRPVRLQGTARQVEWGESLRRVRLASVRRRADPITVAALSIIKDATWFIANKECTLAQLKWPAPEQVECRTPAGATS